MAVKKPTRFSYSRLNQMENCPFAYYLKYEQKHFPKDSALTMEYGNFYCPIRWNPFDCFPIFGVCIEDCL